MRSLRGFTLAELLVVIAIIAILAAILFPVFIQAQDTARMGNCASNLKQLATAFSAYFDDYNGYSIPGPVPANMTLRPEPLIPYVAQSAVSASEDSPKRVWICPGDNGMGNEPPVWKATGAPLSSYMYSYGAFLSMPGNTDVLQGTTGVNAPRRPEQWARPSRDMLLCDASANFHRGRKDVSSSSSAGNSIKCMNFLMLDGHVIAGSRGHWLKVYPYYAAYDDNPYAVNYDPTRERKP